MKKSVCTIFFAVIALSAFAVEVDEKELQVTGSADVRFENYNGPHYVIESASAIKGIGSALGNIVAQNLETPAEIQPLAKYSVIHAVSAEHDEKSKFDADIFVLNNTASVDHIRNLRRILTGYLEAAYGYSTEDADTVATFVTVYNAVYRGQMNIFTERYSPEVIKYLDAEKVGLSTDYKDWAGNTQIVIPLSEILDNISAVETSVISDEKVVEALKKEKDKGVETREKLNQIKEKEATTATVKAQQAQKAAATQRVAAKNAPTKEARSNAEVKAKSAEKTAAVQQSIADRKAKEVKTSRADIDNDKKIIAKEKLAESKDNLTGLIVLDENTGLYSLITVNGTNGELVRRSPAKYIRNTSTYTLTNISIRADDGSSELYPVLYMAICGDNTPNAPVRLCLIDELSLEIKKESEELLSAESDLVLYNAEYFAIVNRDSHYYIGAFDRDLKLKKISTIEVSKASPIMATTKGLFVTDAKGNPQLLRATDLSPIWQKDSASSDAK